MPYPGRTASKCPLGALVRHAELSSRAATLFAALGRHDWEQFFAQADPEAEWTPVDENASYRGRGALTGYFERRLAPWVEFALELETVEFSPTGDRMLTTARYQGRVGGSAKLISGRLSCVIELRAGRFWRGEEYPTRDAAREAFQWHQ